MNCTVDLMRIIGSPFLPEDYQSDVLLSSESAGEIFKYATKNKIGLLYLETLAKQGLLEKFNLNADYEEQQKKYTQQHATLTRISKIFQENHVEHAVIKSIMPFPAVPNDVDIIHFGSHAMHNRAADIMLNSGYQEVKGSVVAMQRMFHDKREHPHLIPKQKDVFDIDLYQEMAVSYVLYLDKRMLQRYVEIRDITGNPIVLLKPEAELLAIIVHSMVPEMLFTLFVNYATLYYVKSMNRKSLQTFIDLVKEANVTYPVKAHFTLIAQVHQKCFGFIPEEIQIILKSLGTEEKEASILQKKNFKTPHRYSSFALVKTLSEKFKSPEFRKSAFNQGMRMANPQLTGWVAYNIKWRRTRETY